MKKIRYFGKECKIFWNLIIISYHVLYNIFYITIECSWIWSYVPLLVDYLIFMFLGRLRDLRCIFLICIIKSDTCWVIFYSQQKQDIILQPWRIIAYPICSFYWTNHQHDPLSIIWSIHAIIICNYTLHPQFLESFSPCSVMSRKRPVR